MPVWLLALAIASASEDARSVLRRVGCQKCHDSAVSTDNRAALRIYDLVDPKWSDHMTDRQLPLLLQRLRGSSAPDVAVVKRFVDEELRDRKR